MIPPTIGYQEPDPECDLNYVPNQAVEAKVDFAASTSLGFGGHNGCLVFKRVEERESKSMNVKEIKTLVGIMEDSSLTALEIEVPDLKLRLERSAGTGSVAEVLQPPVYSVPAAAPARRRKPFRRRLPRLSSLPPQSRRPRPGRTLSIKRSKRLW